jgi:N-acetylmuramic acid 6-phosphate (MurNAc-6-P) etherase
MYKEKIVNVATNEETWRDFTNAEIAEVEAAQAEAAEKLLEAEAKEAARQVVCTKLGLTAEEAQALLG